MQIHIHAGLAVRGDEATDACNAGRRRLAVRGGRGRYCEGRAEVHVDKFEKAGDGGSRGQIRGSGSGGKGMQVAQSADIEVPGLRCGVRKLG